MVVRWLWIGALEWGFDWGLQRGDKNSIMITRNTIFFPVGVAMNVSPYCVLMFVCFGIVLCVPGILLDSVQAQESERINIFDQNNRNAIPWEAQRGSDNDTARRISESFRQDFDPDARQSGRVMKNYAIFLGIAAALIACFVGWQMWRQKRLASEVNDPMFLVYELNSVHQLSEQEKRLMQELSEKNSLSTPLKLFVEPKYLLDAWQSETYASSQPTIRQLLSKLFDIVKA